MSAPGEWARRLGILLQWRRRRRELEAEMQLHRELRAAEIGEAAAARRFGNDLRWRERSQDAWGWSWLESLGQDVRHGWRLLARTPVATALALLSLTLGIGANLALFGLTDAVLLRSLPVSHPGQLVELYRGSPQAGRPSPVFTNPMWEQVRNTQRVFNGAFAWSYTYFHLGSANPRPSVEGAYASGGYFRTLGIQAERGRLFTTADDYPGCPSVANISDAFWRRYFNGSPAAIGATLLLSGHPFQVIGVTPPGFFGVQPGYRFDVTVPLCTQALSAEPMLQVRDAWWLWLMGRLKPGESRTAAQAQLQAGFPQVLAGTVPPDYNAKQRADYLSARVQLHSGASGYTVMRAQYGLSLELLLGVAGVLLLIACANLAGWMLARAAARKQEIAVRMALGASRARLVRQFLTESLLLAGGGAALGAGFAVWLSAAMEQFVSNAIAHVYLNLAPDSRMLAFFMGMTLATALLVGLVPALRATRQSLAGQARAEAAPRADGSRGVVAVQLALSLLLLAGSGLFLHSLLNLVRAPKGFDPREVNTVSVASAARPLPDAVVALQRQQLLAALRALPGVRSVCESFMIPTSGLEWDNVLTAQSGAAIPDAMFNAVSPGYFATLRSTLLQGREFSAADRAGSPPVVILNEEAARELFPRGHALGSYVHQPSNSPEVSASTRVVGIVGDAKYLSLRDDDVPAAYYPLAQLSHPFPTTSYELRSSLPQGAIAVAVRSAFDRWAPRTSYTLGALESTIDSGIKPERLLAWLSGLFGGLALLLSAIGLYGVMSYHARRRQREFAVRVSLGATPRLISRLVLRDAAVVLAWGAGLGLLLAWLAARAAETRLTGLLYQLKPTNAITLLGAALLLTAVALVAAWLPARRAARSDPMEVLRQE